MARIPDKIIEQVAATAHAGTHLLRGESVISFDFALGVVHEWIAAESTPLNHAHRAQWIVPHGVLLALAWKMLRADDGEQGSAWGAHAHDANNNRVIVWIGRRVWPSPRAMLGVDGSRTLLARSIFVDPACDRSRSAVVNQLWTVQQSLACDAVMTVIWDASGFDLTATRRTQLAAARQKERPPVLALAVRPWHERGKLSSAATRWSVTAHAAEVLADSAQSLRRDSAQSSPTGSTPHWRAELVRARGALGACVGTFSFVVGATWSWVEG